MTLICHDIKYFSGNKYPYEIINKYRQRGYSIILNNNEITSCIKDSYYDQNWKEYYNNFDINNKMSISKNILGYLDINSIFFKNNKNNKTNKYNSNNYLDEYINQLIFSNDSNNSNNKLHDIYFKIFSIIDLKVINKLGYINQINKYYFDLLYEQFR